MGETVVLRGTDQQRLVVLNRVLLGDLTAAEAATVLEMSTQNTTKPPFYQHNTGRVVRQTGPSSLEPVLTGLEQPVRMSFGPDGARTR